MEYPQINVSLEAIRAREGQPIEDLDLNEFQFHVDSYQPGAGGMGHFHGELREQSFADLNELCDIVANQSDLPAEAFFYQEALATCDEIEQELGSQGIHVTWKDQMIISNFTGKHPARARVGYFQAPGEDRPQALAVLRDGAAIKHFRPWQGD